MKHLEFTFEQPLWEQILESVPVGGTLDAMRYIAFCDSKKLFSFELGQENLAQLSQITEAYLTAQLERGFSTLDFYKSLLI